MATPKQVAQEVLDSLPEDSSLEEIAYRLYVRASVEQGMRDLDAGRTVPHEQVIREAAEWLGSMKGRAEIRGDIVGPALEVGAWKATRR